jgi:hypothetical protein
MNKELVKKLLTKTEVELSDLNTFITEYVKEIKNYDVTIEELNGIVKLIQMQVFNLRFALMQSAIHLGLNVMSVFNNKNELLRTDVYESF